MATNEMLRASDTERDRVVDALREHYAQGRLARDELDERSATAYAAKTVGELSALTKDLPDEQDSTGRERERRSGSVPVLVWPAVTLAVVVTGIVAAAVVTGHGGFVWLVWIPIVIMAKLGRRMRYSAATGWELDAAPCGARRRHAGPSEFHRTGTPR